VACATGLNGLEVPTAMQHTALVEHDCATLLELELQQWGHLDGHTITVDEGGPLLVRAINGA
jgi:hypothetical protein